MSPTPVPPATPATPTTPLTRDALAAWSVKAIDAFGRVSAAQAAPDQPHATYRALDDAYAGLIGHTLFTILSYDGPHNESTRLYSNLPADYPTGVKKPLSGSRWTDTVLTRGEAFIGSTPDDLREVFGDHALIASLGCESVLNLPVRWQGRTLGSINLLHGAHWYDDAPVAIAQALAQCALPALLTRPPDAPDVPDAP
ncbi:GAF domain-containing protein [Paraburkholderia sp.]|uniref:GAF domain-containing protein n=1 Tax=Paraburkholderia sp. TaxID=1926495 RepID=UPI00239A3F06|nr:GAF domain-containing protein [Paraburkholderia sp.]MDE1180765.1 GAF domain-containing protein [Paraburkholderia sp.]